MNKLKGKFRAWKSGKHWMYAGAMVIIATGMCTAKVTLADTSALEKQGNNNNDGRTYLNREEENNRSQFAQGSQDGYDDAKNGKDRRPKQSESDYTLGYDYGYSYGQKDKAKKDAREAALQDEEDRELDDKLIDQQISEAYKGGYDAGFSGSAMTLSPDLPQELQEIYRDGYLEGQKDKAKKDAREAALQDEGQQKLSVEFGYELGQVDLGQGGSITVGVEW